MVLKVDDNAVNELNKVLQQHEVKNVRVYLAGKGCSGPVFGLALDEPKENDQVDESTGIKFLVDQSLLEEYGGFFIEAVGDKFRIMPAVAPKSSGCSTCGGSCE